MADITLLFVTSGTTLETDISAQITSDFRRTSGLEVGHLTTEFNLDVGHLNGVLAPGWGIWPQLNWKVQMPGGLPGGGGGGICEFRIDRYITPGKGKYCKCRQSWFCRRRSKSAEGGPNPRGVQIRCDTGTRSVREWALGSGNSYDRWPKRPSDRVQSKMAARLKKRKCKYYRKWGWVLGSTLSPPQEISVSW